MTGYIFLGVIVVFAAFSTANPNNPQSFYPTSRPKNESVKGFHNLFQQVNYPEKIWHGGDATFLHNGYRVNPKTRSLTKRSDDVVCRGFLTKDKVYKNCVSLCVSSSCVNGKCVGSTECKCDVGYIKSQTHSYICHPRCKSTHFNGGTELQRCTCDKGYRLSSNQQTCEPICDQKMWNGKLRTDPQICYGDSSNHNIRYGQFCSRECGFGECVGPDTCKCFDGYTKNKDGQCFVPICIPECVHGECVSPNTCKCLDGYRLNSYDPCREPICDKGCVNGDCVAPNTCKCWHGYNKTEDGQCLHLFCSRGCGHGKCVAPNKCNCTDGYGMNTHGQCLDPICNEGCRNGNCVGPEICRCDDGFVNPKSDNGTCVRDCARGLPGESCEEPVMCVIALHTPHNSDKSIGELSEFSGTFDVTINVQVDTALPTCHEKCLIEIATRNIANFTRSTAGMTYYFVPINSACNKMGAYDTDSSQKSTTTTVLIITAIILFATIFSVLIFVRRKRSNARVNRDIPVYDDAGAVHLYEPLKRRYFRCF